MKNFVEITARTLSAICCAALLSAAVPAHASVLRTETLGKGFCGGPCVDLWKVRCENPLTDRVTARVRKTDPASSGAYEVTTLGYVGYVGTGVKGQADREVSKVDGSFSVPAFITRPGNSHAATRILVAVGRLAGKFGEAYDVEFTCSDIFTATETGKPAVKLVGDE
jgi:hypothetical protein